LFDIGAHLDQVEFAFLAGADCFAFSVLVFVIHCDLLELCVVPPGLDFTFGLPRTYVLRGWTIAGSTCRAMMQPGSVPQSLFRPLGEITIRSTQGLRRWAAFFRRFG